MGVSGEHLPGGTGRAGANLASPPPTPGLPVPTASPHPAHDLPTLPPTR